MGNENWGCGGNMSAEYYINEYRRYATFLRDFGENRLYKIAGGPHDGDTHWTEVLMSQLKNQGNHWLAAGLSLHYYTLGAAWQNKLAATGFGEEQWFPVLRDALKMDELLTRHSTVMDKYDPEQEIGLIVDEWGTWYQVEAGTNPGFLYQQNSLRDALVAAIHLNIFNRQPLEIQCADYSFGGASLPAVSGSASRNGDGVVHVTLANLDPNQAVELACDLRGVAGTQLTGRVLTAPTMDAHNSFDQPDPVRLVPFTGATHTEAGITLNLPAKSVVVLAIA